MTDITEFEAVGTLAVGSLIAHKRTGNVALVLDHTPQRIIGVDTLGSAVRWSYGNVKPYPARLDNLSFDLTPVVARAIRYYTEQKANPQEPVPDDPVQADPVVRQLTDRWESMWAAAKRTADSRGFQRLYSELETEWHPPKVVRRRWTGTALIQRTMTPDVQVGELPPGAKVRPVGTVTVYYTLPMDGEYETSEGCLCHNGGSSNWRRRASDLPLLTGDKYYSAELVSCVEVPDVK